MKTYSGLVTNVSKGLATISLKKHGDGMADIRVPSLYKQDDRILVYDMGDTVNVTLTEEGMITTHKYNGQIFYVAFKRDGDDLIITEQNLVDKEEDVLNEQ